ncbi:MAG: hypothetical protein ACOCQP_03925 [Lentisphaeria bacterium]
MKLSFVGNSTDTVLRKHLEMWNFHCFAHEKEGCSNHQFLETEVVTAPLKSRDIFNDFQADAVLAFVPLDLLPPLIRGLEGRKPVILWGTPSILTPEEKNRLTKLGKKTRIRIGSLWPARFYPGIAKLKETIASGCFGRITRLFFELPYTLSMGDVFEPGKDDLAKLPTPFHSLPSASHILDTVLWLLQSDDADENLLTTRLMQQLDSGGVELNCSVNSGESIDVIITQNAADTDATTIRVEGEQGYVMYQGGLFCNPGLHDKKGRFDRRFQTPGGEIFNPDPLYISEQQAQKNYFGILQKALSDNICFDYFFQKGEHQLCFQQE